MFYKPHAGEVVERRSEPAPSLVQFETWVKEGKIHYFIGGGNGGGPGGSSSTSVSTQISSWVESHYAATTIGGVTVYDLAPGGVG